MQPKLCTKCKKNIAVVFITKLEAGKTMNEGYCLKCARSLGIPQIDEAVKQMGISEEDLDLLALKVCANGFLYNMARAMAGTLVYAAEGKIKPEEIGAILESGNRTAAGPTVPPGGLYMSHLWYDDGVEKFECTPWQD